MPVSEIVKQPVPQICPFPIGPQAFLKYPPQPVVTGYIRNPEVQTVVQQLRHIGRTMEYYSPSYSSKSFFEAVALPTNGDFSADDIHKLVYWKGKEFPDIFCHYLLKSETYKESLRLIKSSSSLWGPEIESLLVMLVAQSCGLKVVLLKDFSPPIRWDAEKIVNDTHVVVAREKDAAGHCFYYACLKLDPSDKNGGTIMEINPTHALSWVPLEKVGNMEKMEKVEKVEKMTEECDMKSDGKAAPVVYDNPHRMGQGRAMDQISRLGLVAVPVPQNNNSFFESVWRRSGVEFDFPSARQMRMEVQAHADVNRDDFSLYLPDSLDYSSAVELMFHDEAWSPDWEELATNVLLELGINLIVLHDFKEPVRPEGCETDPYDPERHTVIAQNGQFYISTKNLP